MARIAGVDLPKEKRVEIGLTYIYGIGRTSANKILAEAGISPDVRVKDLSEEDEAKLREMAAEGELPDVITFAGNGEPTAAPEFPQAIAGAIALRDQLAPNTKIAVLSNGTRADQPAVHDALMMVDDNILKLDTVDPAFIQLLDQPVGPYDVEHQIETFASFNGHVIIQTIFLNGEYQGKSLDNTGEAYVGPWLAALERIRPQEATIYTVARETPVAGLAKAAPVVLDTIAARVRALGIPCQVSY